MMYDISSLMSHCGDMIFVDKIKKYLPNYIQVEATIKPTNPFLEENKLPCFTYIEIMAQAIAVLAGLQDKKYKRNLALNLLLACRGLEMNRDFLRVGTTVNVEAKESLFQENGFALYNCGIFEGDVLVAKANLNVFAPNEVKGI